ncbi:MAG: pantoate--beta-alanine ligase [Rhodospirillales bacterium]|nr:pantoate--beta-alanine ligase [Rhodospirillales bacterium]
MKVVRKVSELRSVVQQWRGAGLNVALVPTMGALHTAHAALVADARNRADRVVATIFVNPRQFGDDEDLAEYPRTEEADLRQLRAGSVDLVFAPPVDEMYPERFATSVVLTGPAEGLCGAARPGHFDGVATVVAKLLLQCLPDVAVFGEKDYQQLLVIRRMAQDLDIPVQIAGVPTVREADGLACSSRNGYLNPSERASAPALYQSLRSAAQQISDGSDVLPAVSQARDSILNGGFQAVEYIELRRAETLDHPSGRDGTPVRLLAAAQLGTTRLIDNVGLTF